MLGPRQRMTRHEMHALRQMRSDLRDYITLDRTHIGDSRPLCQMRRNLGGDRTNCTGRHAQHDQIGTLDRIGRRFGDAIT